MLVLANEWRNFLEVKESIVDVFCLIDMGLHICEVLSLLQYRDNALSQEVLLYPLLSGKRGKLIMVFLKNSETRRALLALMRRQVRPFVVLIVYEVPLVQILFTELLLGAQRCFNDVEDKVLSKHNCLLNPQWIYGRIVIIM